MPAAPDPQGDPRRLEDLVRTPREAPDLELKGRLDLSENRDKAKLAKELIALANHGGGFCLIGFDEAEDGSGVEAPDRPGSLDGFSHDVIRGVIERYAEPNFTVEVHQAGVDPSLPHPIVIVPGGHTVPIRTRRAGPDGDPVAHCYYIRRGSTSEAPQSGREWDALLRMCLMNRREELLGELRHLFARLSGDPLETPTDEPGQMAELAAFASESRDPLLGDTS